MEEGELRIANECFPYSLLATHYSRFTENDDNDAQMVASAFSFSQAKKESEAKRRQTQ
jgi:hypothetical protein